MKPIKELRDEYLRIREEMRDLVNRAKNEKRDLTDEENAQFLKMHNDQEAAQRAIDVANHAAGLEEKAEERFEKSVQKEAEISLLTGKPVSNRKEKKDEYRDVFGKWLRRGVHGLDPNERKLLAEYRGTNIIVTDDTTTYGTYTVPQEFSNELERTMALFGGMLQASRVIPTRTGGTLDWPTLNDTTTSANWITAGEGNAVTVQDLTFGQTQFGAYTLATLAKMSVEFVQDESVNIVTGELNAIFGERMGRAVNLALTTGDGSSKPTGFVTSATTGKTAASPTAVTRAEIVDLIHSVDPAYRTGPNVYLMFNDTTLAAIKKLSIGSADDRPLWQMGITAGEPPRLEGFRYIINQDMADIAASAKPIAFGDFSKYIVRRAADYTMRRLDELYMENLSIGFIMWGRFDGKLLNTAAVKVLANPSS